jgi:sterol 3beta-glucosyltransferase
MNILIPTIGSRGDVQPFIALAQALARAGHSVTLASHPVMRSLVESHGVTFVPIGPDIDLAREVAAIRHRSRNVIVGLVRGMRFGFNMLERSHEDISSPTAVKRTWSLSPRRSRLVRMRPTNYNYPT